MDFFEKLSGNIKSRLQTWFIRLVKYFKRLLFPIYLFPLKLLTYSVYYLILFIFKLVFAFLALVIDCIVFPFKSLKNLLKFIVYLAVTVYLIFSVVVIFDYLSREYGSINKMFCGTGVNSKLKKS